ncbi:MAG TPA: type II toxin-antitoxin system VapC family toxin [Propionibacteriaceae bacterium]|nr:type II toxin-antitoxin system VapC family toxin [Propionibacteriaceae bacterium]
MIVDTSALVAIILGEPERESYLERITQAQRRLISAASYVELGIVIDSRRDPVLSRTLDQLLAALEIEVVPLTVAQATIARGAHHDFGRGSGHAARLNLGDCFAYALAKDTDEPLLWKGDDFGHTDVRRP